MNCAMQGNNGQSGPLSKVGHRLFRVTVFVYNNIYVNSLIKGTLKESKSRKKTVDSDIRQPIVSSLNYVFIVTKATLVLLLHVCNIIYKHIVLRNYEIIIQIIII